VKLLTMDVGNTHIVVGLYNGEQLIGKWRISTDTHRTEDEYFHIIHSFLDDINVKREDIKGFIVSNVVPSLDYVLHRMSEKYLGVKPFFISSEKVPWVTWNVKNEEEIGADRVANVCGGYEKYGKNVIIIDFGTAITFDVLAKGKFEGGLILPGIGISFESLFTKAAKLPMVEFYIPSEVIGKDTIANIQSGISRLYMHGITGIIDDIFARYDIDFSVVTTGGFGRIFANKCDNIDSYDPDITLFGLYTAYVKADQGDEKN